MKYANAKNTLPEQLLAAIQKYYQGGYLYIPQGKLCEIKQQTDYQIELEKRNRQIYLKHLEGRTCGQLESIYHLSASSIRRIIAKEKVRYQKMKEIIAQLLPLWGMENRNLLQIYPSAWEINHSYILKVYDDKEQLERNIKTSAVLSDCGIPVARIIPTKTGEKYAAHQNTCFLMSHKLPGSNISDIKDKKTALKMGCAIARLHRAFIKCETEISYWDNSLLKEMTGWVRENLARTEWQMISEEEYSQATASLEAVYDSLPKQLIHRDVHFGNFLFSEGELSGYIDFDISQRNIRIFDICYFLTGLLAEKTAEAFTQNEWMENVKAAITGYESILQLSADEKIAIPCVMECIEILFAAYFISLKDTKCAGDACRIFHFLQHCEQEVKNAIL